MKPSSQVAPIDKSHRPHISTIGKFLNYQVRITRIVFCCVSLGQGTPLFFLEQI